MAEHDDSWRYEDAGEIAVPPEEDEPIIYPFSDPDYNPLASAEEHAARIAASSHINQDWLPRGRHSHWGYVIEHKPLEDGGPLVHGGRKGILHTTESREDQVDAMWRVLRDKNAAPHVVEGRRRGEKLQVAIQAVRLRRGARALEHPKGTPATNAGGDAVVQFELSAFASNSQNMTDRRLKLLANLFVLVQHRVPIPAVSRQDFSHPHRMGALEWILYAGLAGHSMAPNQRANHTDPGRFREGVFIRYIKEIARRREPFRV
jgi:hypothetical protein